jgi:hypothetical protein
VQNYHRNSSAGIFQLMLLAVLIVLAGAIATGCSTGPPDKVVAKFTMAIADRDLDKARSLCTDRFANVYLTSMDAIHEQIPPGTMPGSGDLKLEDVRAGLMTSEEGDTAKVWMPEADFMKYVLVKEGSMWKIDAIEFDWEAMMDQMGNMGFDMSNLPH